MIIEDGSLPSNVGGGGNVRNILRRVFGIMQKRGWWKEIGEMDGFMEIFAYHKKDLEDVSGKFKEYKSFRQIMEVEYERWRTTDDSQQKQLEKILKKNGGKLSLKDWMVAIESWGIPADTIAEISGLRQPGNLYYELDLKQQKTAKAQEAILYNTVHLKETENLYYKDHTLLEFDTKIQEIFANITQNNKFNIFIFEESAFYPTSGGQQNDVGEIWVGEEKFDVVNVERVGKSILHILDRGIEDPTAYKGKTVKCKVDKDRRSQLRSHHTGTHIVFASCRRVLGPHVWQNGAKKTIEKAHLDITHYKSLTHEEEKRIENEANRIISECVNINKSLMNKADAEKEHGFSLYQGGIVPGNELRVVNIEGIDTEACCGTHCDNTAEVGWIRILKT